jgi:hypothetical protein
MKNTTKSAIVFWIFFAIAGYAIWHFTGKLAETP